MALIKCKECGSMISDRAIKCPKCGCPNDGLDVTKAQGNERFVPSGVPAEPAGDAFEEAPAQPVNNVAEEAPAQPEYKTFGKAPASCPSDLLYNSILIS